jgi:radical SAM family RiPP maturation amino acid epimerase
MAFELSTGCSVGCWFCALGATRFKGHFKRTPDNVKLWRDVLGTAVDLFGSSVQTSFCYWATEPFDNPNYLDFLQDYREIVGTLPQTTSAAPLRDIVWTKRLMEMQRTGPRFPSRFSITSRNMLQQVHETFSPMELLRYELLMQHGDSSYPKARAGKTLAKENPEGRRPMGRMVAAQPTTIACVSGFFINMMKKSIQLVSPCQANDRWPLGYRTHLTGSFSNGREFGEFIEQAIATCMPLDLPADRPVLFRECFDYESKVKGFTLKSEFSSVSFTGSHFIRTLGDLISQGIHTPADIVGSLLAQGADLFEIRGTLKDLFDKGVLEDLPGVRDPGAK